MYRLLWMDWWVVLSSYDIYFCCISTFYNDCHLVNKDNLLAHTVIVYTFGGGLARWSRSTKLNYVGPGYYWDGWLCPGSIPGAGHLSRYVTSHPGQLSLAIPSSVGAMSTSQRAVMPCGWGVNAGMVRMWVEGKTVYPLVTQGPYLSSLEIKGLYVKRIYKALYKLICLLLLYL